MTVQSGSAVAGQIAGNLYHASGGWTYLNAGEGVLANFASGEFTIYTAASGAAAAVAGITERFHVTLNGNVLFGAPGGSGLATTAVDGFPNIPFCLGTPTGAATSYTGTGLVPIVVDWSNMRLYVRVQGAWKYAQLV